MNHTIGFGRDDSQKRWAHGVLDDVKAGREVSDRLVRRALWTLGEPCCGQVFELPSARSQDLKALAA